MTVKTVHSTPLFPRKTRQQIKEMVITGQHCNSSHDLLKHGLRQTNHPSHPFSPFSVIPNARDTAAWQIQMHNQTQ
jgi:hypothetical protein